METRKENQQNDVIDLKELFFVYVKNGGCFCLEH